MKRNKFLIYSIISSLILTNCSIISSENSGNLININDMAFVAIVLSIENNKNYLSYYKDISKLIDKILERNEVITPQELKSEIFEYLITINLKNKKLIFVTVDLIIDSYQRYYDINYLDFSKLHAYLRKIQINIERASTIYIEPSK